MLRITIDEDGDSIVLRLEGQLIAPWVADVEQCWRRVFDGTTGRAVHIDLSAVSFVDSSGEALLTRMHKAGFRIAGSSSIRQFLDDLEHGPLSLAN